MPRLVLPGTLINNFTLLTDLSIYLLSFFLYYISYLAKILLSETPWVLGLSYSLWYYCVCTCFFTLKYEVISTAIGPLTATTQSYIRDYFSKFIHAYAMDSKTCFRSCWCTFQSTDMCICMYTMLHTWDTHMHALCNSCIIAVFYISYSCIHTCMYLWISVLLLLIVCIAVHAVWVAQSDHLRSGTKVQ